MPVCVRHAGESDWGPNDQYERISSAHFSLELTTEGSGIVEINGAQHLFVPGDMLIVGPRDYCRYYTGPARRWRKTYVALQPEGVAVMIAHMHLKAVCHVRLGKPAFGEAARCFRALIGAIRAQPRGFRERVSLLGYHMLLLARHAVPAPLSAQRYPAPLQRAIVHAEARHGAVDSVAQLARIAGCSRQHLSTLFSAHLGMGVHAWLTQLRINHARTLLETTLSTIEAVARHTGYTDQFHFSRVFKRVTGVAPQHYRDSLLAHRTLPAPVQAATRQRAI